MSRLAGRHGGDGRHVLDETLVDAHLVAVPGLGTLTARGLAGGDLEGLGGQADGALDAQVLALGALDQLGADLLEGLDLAAGQGDADLVGLLYCWGRTISMCDRVAMVVRRESCWTRQSESPS